MSFAATFARLRQLSGSPVLTCVKPRAQWTGTPSGYTFDNDYDMFLDGDGNQWTPTSAADLSANDYVTVPFLSGAGDAEIALSAAGLVDDGTVFGRILPGDQATVAAAQWLELDGLTYNKTALTPMPRGVGTWYALRMDKR